MIFFNFKISPKEKKLKQLVNKTRNLTDIGGYDKTIVNLLMSQIELVCIGRHLDVPKITVQLNACLINNREL